VLLSLVEGISIADAATVLDADVTLVRKAQAIRVREFTPTSRELRPRRALALPQSRPWLDPLIENRSGRCVSAPAAACKVTPRFW
jgi:hypothetical protein